MLLLIFVISIAMGVDSEEVCLNSTNKCNALVLYDENKPLSEFYKTIKKFNFTSVGEIKILQEYDSLGVAGVVWEGATVLGDYLAKNGSLEGLKILELGAGTGLAGIVASKLGAQVTLTDLKKNLNILKRNIDINFNVTESRPLVKELEWNVDLKNFSLNTYNLIIGADIIYSVETFRDLLKTIDYFLCSKEIKNPPKVIFSSKLRYDRVETFNRMAQKLYKLKTTLLYFEPISQVKVYEISD